MAICSNNASASNNAIASESTASTPAATDMFQPIKIGTKLSRNRIEVAPAAPFLAGHDGSLTQEFYKYNESLATSGAGIITLGVSPVDPGTKVGSRVMSLGSDLFLPDFNELAELFHRHGALASVELVYTRYMLAPPNKTVNETTTEEVESMIKAFADAAVRVMKSGFDIAMIHGGHGNVPAMFFNKAINKRTDRFGGSFEGRARFAVELLQAMRERVGDKIAIEYRISAEEMIPGMTTLDETIEFVKLIEPYIDLLHVSRGVLEVDDLLHYIFSPLYLPRALNLPFAVELKKHVSIPVTVVGSFNTATAQEAIASGQVDMVSLMRNVLADNECVEKERLGLRDQIRPCMRCNTCIDRTHTDRVAVRCAVNPTLGRETRIGRPEDKPINPEKRIAVVGGGPAGMQAALTLAARGGKPVLFEATNQLGGLLRLAAADPMKVEVREYLQWLIRMVHQQEEAGALSVRMSTKASAAELKAEGFTDVIVACGLEPNRPSFTKTDALPVMWVGDVDQGFVEPVGKIALVGAGMTGMECALSLSRKGYQVVLIDPKAESTLGAGGAQISVRCLKELLRNNGVEFCCETLVEGITAEGVQVRSAAAAAANESHVIPCDSVVFSLGFHPIAGVEEEFLAQFPQVKFVGDCNRRVANVFNATMTAYDAAMMP